MTTAINEQVVRDVVQEVLTQLKGGGSNGGSTPTVPLGASSPISARPSGTTQRSRRPSRDSAGRPRGPTT